MRALPDAVALVRKRPAAPDDHLRFLIFSDWLKNEAETRIPHGPDIRRAGGAGNGKPMSADGTNWNGSRNFMGVPSGRDFPCRPGAVESKFVHPFLTVSFANVMIRWLKPRFRKV